MLGCNKLRKISCLASRSHNAYTYPIQQWPQFDPLFEPSFTISMEQKQFERVKCGKIKAYPPTTTATATAKRTSRLKRNRRIPSVFLSLLVMIPSTNIAQKDWYLPLRPLPDLPFASKLKPAFPTALGWRRHSRLRHGFSRLVSVAGENEN